MAVEPLPPEGPDIPATASKVAAQLNPEPSSVLAKAPIIVSLSVAPDVSKALLSESWTEQPGQEELEGTGIDAPAFNPAAPEYNELAKRMSRSFAMKVCAEQRTKVLELSGKGNGAADSVSWSKEAREAALEEAKARLSEAEAALAELQTSFTEPLALVPWMNTLFAVADAGCTTLEASAARWPYCARLADVVGTTGAHGACGSASAGTGAQCILGAFKKRYERERGPQAAITVLARLTPNMWATPQGGGPAALAASLEAGIERARANLQLGDSEDEVGKPLDCVLLEWLDFEAADPLPVLRALARLLQEKTRLDVETGEVTIVQPCRVKALALAGFPAEQLQRVVQHGVPVGCCVLPYSLLDMSSAPAVGLARRHDIHVVASGCLVGGLLSERYLGAPQPLDMSPAGTDAVNRYGGWQRFQALLRSVHAVAQRHGVSMEAVALRWVMDQGVTPLVELPLARASPGSKGATGSPCSSNGYSLGAGSSGCTAAAPEWLEGKVLRPGASFLDASDLAALAKLTSP